jgi:hypothetical protein
VTASCRTEDHIHVRLHSNLFHDVLEAASCRTEGHNREGLMAASCRTVDHPLEGLVATGSRSAAEPQIQLLPLPGGPQLHDVIVAASCRTEGHLLVQLHSRRLLHDVLEAASCRTEGLRRDGIAAAGSRSSDEVSLALADEGAACQGVAQPQRKIETPTASQQKAIPTAEAAEAGQQRCAFEGPATGKSADHQIEPRWLQDVSAASPQGP